MSDKDILKVDIKDTKKILQYLDNQINNNNFEYLYGNIEENKYIIINRYLDKLFKKQLEILKQLEKDLKNYE